MRVWSLMADGELARALLVFFVAAFGMLDDRRCATIERNAPRSSAARKLFMFWQFCHHDLQDAWRRGDAARPKQERRE